MTSPPRAVIQARLGGVALTALLLGGCHREPPESRATSVPPAADPAAEIAEARELVEDGRVAEGADRLAAVASADAGPNGDRAALLLGDALISSRRFAEALGPLSRAMKAPTVPEHAALLFLRAAVESGAADRRGEAEEVARRLMANPTSGAVVTRDAEAWLIELLNARGDFAGVIDVGRNWAQRWPGHARAHRVRWLVAEALRASGASAEASRTFEEIWYDTPGSPWAREARASARALQDVPGVVLRRLTPAQRIEHVRALQRVGLHEDALEACNIVLAEEVRADVLALQAQSLHGLRRDAECVAVAERSRLLFPGSPASADAAIWAIKCHRRRDLTAEVERWADWVATAFAGSSAATTARYELGVYLCNTGMEERGMGVLEAIVRDSPQAAVADDVLWKMAWQRIRHGEDRPALDVITELLAAHPETGFRKAALYWQGRVLERIDVPRALDSYRRVVAEFPHDYYGHMALDKLLAAGERNTVIGNGRAFEALDELDVPSRVQDEAYTRACVLAGVGLHALAAEELEAVEVRDPGVRFAQARELARAGRTSEAAALLRAEFPQFVVSGSRDPQLVPPAFWRTCYPFPYRRVIVTSVREAGLDQSNIDSYLVAALIRMESEFNPEAISPAGAIGLMQLMPATADAIASERGLPPPTRSGLFDPEVNIRFGVYHLAKSAKEFRGDWFAVICSYNAGSGPVREWLARRPPDQPLDVFIDDIPYRDTRLYVKQVLGDYANYEWIYPTTRG